jgi:hypothetical protein
MGAAGTRPVYFLVWRVGTKKPPPLASVGAEKSRLSWILELPFFKRDPTCLTRADLGSRDHVLPYGPATAYDYVRLLSKSATLLARTPLAMPGDT